MTKLLEKAVKEVSKLSENEQDEMAQLILDEIEDDKKWDESFAKSQNALSNLADEALDEFDKNKTKPLDL
jgi:aspartate/glutamate racemase